MFIFDVFNTYYIGMYVFVFYYFSVFWKSMVFVSFFMSSEYDV
jgi:hypothetical protein